MRLATIQFDGARHVAALTDAGLALLESGPRADLGQWIREGRDLSALGATVKAARRVIDPASATFLPPLAEPPKIFCAGLNYADHTSESPYEQPDYPTLFLRVATSLVGHGQAIERPRVESEGVDFEGEMVVVLGKGGRNVPAAKALDLVVGYSVFNDGSIREYQFKSPQWTVGKNFDRTGGFGPYLVTADEVPAGGAGLKLETRVNGRVVQSANTRDMIHDVATLIATISEAITLQPGDIIVSGTPAGIGWARTPRLLMKDGDVCEVEIEGIGLLSNPIRDQAAG